MSLETNLSLIIKQNKEILKLLRSREIADRWVNAKTFKAETGLSDEGLRRLRIERKDIVQLKDSKRYLFHKIPI